MTSATLDRSATKKTSLRPKTRLLGELFWTLENAEKYFLNIQANINKNDELWVIAIDIKSWTFC